MKQYTINDLQPGMLVRIIIKPLTGVPHRDKYHNTIQRIRKIIKKPHVGGSFFQIHGSIANFREDRAYSVD